MAYPPGYRVVTWDEVAKSSTIHEVYILEDGRDKPYGPYKVVDASKQMVEDTKAIYDRQFPIQPHEVIGVVDHGYVAPVTKADPPIVGDWTTPMTQAQVVASNIYDQLFDAFVTQLASKSSQINQTKRTQLETEAASKRFKAVKLLADHLKP